MEPVPEKDGPLNKSENVETVSKEPIGLPAGFEWVTLNLNDDEQLQNVFELLSQNYVQDEDG